MVLFSFQSDSSSTESSFYYFFVENYPSFCPGSPNYNPAVPVEDCEGFSCCDYSGDLAAIGHQSLEFIQTHDIVAFYDSSDPQGLYWPEVYANKTIELSKTYNGRKVVFNATILDHCVNADCEDCCIKDSASTGYLLVMEHYTVLRHFGSVGAVDGLISFRIFHDV